MPSSRPKKMIDETVSLGPWESVQWKLDLVAGDRIEGIVEEKKGDWLRAYFLDMHNYALKKNGQEFRYLGGEHMGAHSFEFEIPKTSTYYLVVEHDDWWGNKETVIVDLKRTRR